MKEKKYWIFDLDNTLYSSSTKIFDLIDIRMKKFISRELKISQNEAFKIQKELYHEYGTTLSGLIKLYNVQPKKFLDYVHDIDLSKLKKSKELIKFLNHLPGKKIIFTNGDEKWAKRVLSSLGIVNLIDGIYDIIKANYLPKPQKKTYLNFIKRYDLNPNNSVFFEDTEINLKPAYDLGMTTIHIDLNYKKNNLKSFIDHKFNSINSALESINNNYI